MPLSEGIDLKRKEVLNCPWVARNVIIIVQISTFPGLPMLKSRVQGDLSEALVKQIGILRAATRDMGQNQASQVPACRKASTEDRLIVMLGNALLDL